METGKRNIPCDFPRGVPAVLPLATRPASIIALDDRTLPQAVRLNRKQCAHFRRSFGGRRASFARFNGREFHLFVYGSKAAASDALLFCCRRLGYLGDQRGRHPRSAFVCFRRCTSWWWWWWAAADGFLFYFFARCRCVIS